MTRIFLTLASLGVVLLGVAVWLGYAADAANKQDASSFTLHFLTGLGAVVYVTLVHSVVLTYFMGTGRWLEETCAAYRLGADFRRQNIRIKWRVLPFLGLCVLLLIALAASGAAADPGSTIRFQGAFGLSPANLHEGTTVLTLIVNLIVHVWEYFALKANADLVNAVLAEVRRMRLDRGLPV